MLCVLNVMKNNSETGHGGREWGWVYLSRDLNEMREQAMWIFEGRTFQEEGRASLRRERVLLCRKNSKEALGLQQIEDRKPRRKWGWSDDTELEGEQILWVDIGFLSFKRFLLKYS